MKCHFSDSLAAKVWIVAPGETHGGNEPHKAVGTCEERRFGQLSSRGLRLVQAVQREAPQSQVLRGKWWQQQFHRDTATCTLMESLDCCSDRKASKSLGHGDVFSPLLLWLHSFVLYSGQDPPLEPFPDPPSGPQACFYSEAMHLCQGLCPAPPWGAGKSRNSFLFIYFLILFIFHGEEGRGIES